MPTWKKVIVSGSNAALNSLNVTTSLTASGLFYPTTDNGEFSFMQTDGNGNLSFQYVNTTNDTVYNGEATTIVRGTPVYVSGSVGANPKVFRADASNPAKMPVTYIVGDSIAAGSTGRAIILGQIDAVDTTGYPEGTEIYVAPGGGWTSTRPTGTSIVQVLGIVIKEGAGGKGLVLNPGPANLPNLNSGSIWVGNSNSYPTAVSTSSLLVTSASFANNASSSLFAVSSSRATSASFATNAFNATSASHADLLDGLHATAFVLNSQTSSMSVSSATSATNATNASNISVLDTTTGTGPYYLVFADGTTGNRIPRVDSSTLQFNASTNTLTVTNLTGTASFATTASLAISATSASFAINASSSLFAVSSSRATSASFSTNAFSATSASFSTLAATATSATTSTNAATASYVNTLNQSVIITGSATVGLATAGASENTLTLGPSQAGGSGEGGQLGLNAAGGTYTSASFIDNYQNQLRLLRGTNSNSDAGVAIWNLHTKQMQLPAYTASSSFPGTATANLAVDSGGNVITVSTSGGSVFPYTGNAVITGSLTTTGVIYAQPNGAMYFQGGDDAALYDVNISNHMGIYGVQTVTEGGIKLGSNGSVLYGSGSKLGLNTTNPSSASLTVNGNIWATSITGSLLGTSSFATNADLLDGLHATSFVLNSQTSSMTVNSASFAINASTLDGNAANKFVLNSQTSSMTVLSASFAINASSSLQAGNAQTLQGNNANAFVLNSQTSSMTVNSASFAINASSSLFAVSATSATSATTATNANNVVVTDTTTGTGPYYLMFADGTTGKRAVRVDSSTLQFNATTNTLTVPIVNSTTAVQGGNGSASLPAFSFSGDTNTGMYNITADTLGFATSGSERMRINSSGYVSIGNTSSPALLQVGPNNSVSSLFVGAIPGVNQSGGYLSLYTPTAGAASFGSFYFSSVSTSDGDAFGSSTFYCNPEDGFNVSTIGSGSGVAQSSLGVSTGGVSLTAANSVNIDLISYANSSINLQTIGASGGVISLSTRSTSSLYIDTSQRVAIGKTSANAKLDVSGSTIISGTLDVTNNIRTNAGSASTPSYSFSGDTNTGIYNISADTLGIATGGTERLRVSISGSMGLGVTPANTAGRFEASNDIVAYSSSDKRWKKNIKNINSPLEKLSQINGVEFDWIEDEPVHGNKGHDIGVIAQEIEQVLPDIVQTRESGMKAVQYDKIVPLLIESIKEQQKQIDELKELVNKLTK